MPTSWCSAVPRRDMNTSLSLSLSLSLSSSHPFRDAAPPRGDSCPWLGIQVLLDDFVQTAAINHYGRQYGMVWTH